MKNKVVKSVGRVINVLELFREQQSPMTATEICRHLDYPKSSADALLKSLVSLGYISLDSQTMQYFPSLRVTKLGDWLPGVLFSSGHTLNMLEDLNRRTQETVSLAMPNVLSMQFITVIPGTFPISLMVREGFNVPIFTTALGIAHLATRSDQDIEILARRANRRTSQGRTRVDLAAVMGEIETARAKGYAEAYERVLPDTGAIATALPTGLHDRALVISVGGLAERIRKNQPDIIQQMRQVITQFGHDQATQV